MPREVIILHFLIVTLIIVGCYFVLSFLIYRVPNLQKRKVFEGEIIFKAVDINFNFRDFFEKKILGSQSIMLNTETIRFYIHKKDLAIIWKVKPQDLMKDGFGLKVTLSTQPLLFGGYSLSTINEVTKIESSMLRVK